MLKDVSRCLFLVTVVLYCISASISVAYALESTPSVKQGTQFIKESGELDIMIHADTVFRARPVVSTGSAQIWDEVERRWVESSSPWTLLPKVMDAVKLRFSNSTSPKKVLNLVFQNPQNAVLHYSMPVIVWDILYVQNYIESLNGNLRAQQDVAANKVWGW